MASLRKHPCSLLSVFLILLLSEQWILQLEARHHIHRPKSASRKLFVFGDSYADTGNIRRGLSKVWKEPYGSTFPGKPAGRFSDGRVLTDYIAKYLKVKSPLPFGMLKQQPHHGKYGINFAFGGTGVFNTLIPGPNMTTQIDQFESLINGNEINESDLAKSVALVSVAGNDYSNFLATNGSISGLSSFVGVVVNQTALNMQRIHKLGVKKIAVTSLPPLGCVPEITVSSSYKACNDTYNTLVSIHNSYLLNAVEKVNGESEENFSFVMVNLYESFLSVLNATEKQNSHKMENTFKPCCAGVSTEYSCGSVDDKQDKKYRVCQYPNASFFWDMVHPTQAGWHAVYNKLRNTSDLQQLHY
ncbi:GDSL esterase/lipase At5g03610-like [Prosopis cineraria]|uniref:GDSL esterase/lipase At5g03610-like n=1 Tax=Prosopis cineraria TaxID=364024 RepID=UPI00240F6320|nr:GDSL esterase/lipase At5g03610-like [Prosopis cineraria]